MVRILFAVANFIPDMEYVQGLNFIVASLLHVVVDEKTTFYITAQLLSANGLKYLYID
jgi:hypothetical protein